jgi:hypothetical protein
LATTRAPTGGGGGGSSGTGSSSGSGGSSGCNCAWWDVVCLAECAGSDIANALEGAPSYITNAVMPTLGNLGNVLGTVETGVAGIGTEIENSLPTIETDVEEIGPEVATLGPELSTGLAGIASIGVELATNIPVVKTGISDLQNYEIQAYNDLVSGLSGVPGVVEKDISSVFGPAFSQLETYGSDIENYIQESALVPPEVKLISEGVPAITPDIEGFITNWWNNTALPNERSIISQYASEVENVVNSDTADIPNIVPDLENWMKTNVMGSLTTLMGAVEGNYNEITLVDRNVAEIVPDLEQWWSGRALPDIEVAINNAFANFNPEITGLTTDLTELTNTLKSDVNQLVKDIKNVPSNVETYVEDAIDSYAKKLWKKIEIPLIFIGGIAIAGWFADKHITGKIYTDTAPYVEVNRISATML